MSYVALFSDGIQNDVFNACNEFAWDSRKLFLKNRHQVVYNKLPTTNKTYKNELWFYVDRTCDLINNLDLVLENPNSIPINNMIRSITIECAGHKFDSLNAKDIETQIKTNCALFNRKINHINKKTFIPLVMAPLYENNLVTPSTKHQNMIIAVKFCDSYVFDNAEIYSNMYYFKESISNSPYDMITIQNQNIGVEKMSKGQNKFKLHYIHPVCLIYFWGFDKSKVTNIKLLLNGEPYYDGPIEPLEHLKISKGYDVEPCMLLFSQDNPLSITKSSINFSKIEKSELIIDTEEEECRDLHIVALNMNKIMHVDGMAGMKY